MDPKEPGQGLTSLRQGSTDAGAVERHYDGWAADYDATLAAWDYRAPAEVAALLAPHLRPGAEVLDIGCGTGLTGQALARHLPLALDGLDISAASLAQAQARGLYRRLLRHDLQALPLPVAPDAHDAAVTVGVLTYIPDAETLLRALCRAVRPGGVLLFTQRDDLWAERGFDALLARLEGAGLWHPLHVGPPRPYLPGNAEFGQEVQVIHTLCRVV